MKHKGSWYLLIFMMCGLVIGGLIGAYLGKLPYLEFLNYSQGFGLNPPFSLNLGIVNLVLGIEINISVCGVIGLLIGLLAYKKL